MSLNGLFQTSSRSLRVLEGAIQTAGQNIANAGTEGYSRQRLTLRADSVITQGVHSRTPYGTVTGVGVSVQNYERVRDGLLERAANDAHTDLGAAEEEVRTGSALEGLLATGTAGSLTESVASFWDAWNDAANAPADQSVRGVLLDRADALAGAFHRHDDGLTTLALRELEALGFDPSGVASWQTVDDVVIRSPFGTERRYPLPSDTGCHAAVARRQDLDAALVDLLRQAGANLHDGPTEIPRSI